jgi:dihydroneopterin aldolase
MKSYILLENVEFFARHGVLAEEKVTGNRFIINLKIEVDNIDACKNDNLESTVNYAEIYKLIDEEMAVPSKLLEHVAYRILSRIKSQFKLVTHTEIKISKKTPPIEGIIEQASVILTD